MIKTIKSTICTDCICLPMCINKFNSKLIGKCDYINDTINGICESFLNQEDDSVSISFTGLDRKFLIKRIGKQLVIGGTSYGRSHARHI